MALATKHATEIPTIDTVMVAVETEDSMYLLNTASEISVETQTETSNAVRLVVKGKLKAQKHEQVTVTGMKITLTDNVFLPELVQILQGGTIRYYKDSTHSEEQTSPTEFGVAGYTPPSVGSGEGGKIFTLHAFSAQYDTSGEIIRYEKVTYPNCKGIPVAFSSKDGEFRAPSYTINSAPKSNQSPYTITYVDSLPSVD